MKYLLAVSGGVDSVVLLDMLATEGKHELTIGHFDHGIRPDSAADARFVQALAAKYGVPYVGRREELGAKASEELARERRYAFLRSEANKIGAEIMTAHHADDIVETVALNLKRGTGWRGIAVLDSKGIDRPLLPYSKSSIRAYALEKRLEWVEDSTNASDDYLRNRLRRRIFSGLSADSRQHILELRNKQVELKRAIDTAVESHLNRLQPKYSRYFFTNIHSVVASELLRGIMVSATGQGPTRPQLERAVLAIKTARPGSVYPLGGMWLEFTHKAFLVTVKTP